MLVDKGLNDRWVRPEAVRQTAPDRFIITLHEPLGRAWSDEIVTYALPGLAEAGSARVTAGGAPVPCQASGDRLSLLVQDLQPGEERQYEVELSDEAAEAAPQGWGVRLTERADCVEVDNGVLGLRLPRSCEPSDQSSPPGPLLTVRRGEGGWLGEGRLETSVPVISVTTRLAEAGPLWTTVKVAYTFEGGHTYRVEFRLRPGEECCEVREESTLPTRLWPAPRPYREIGSLSASHWNQSLEDLGRPCLRPCAQSNFIFDLQPGLQAERLVTHSTASWEIMDLPLGSPTVKTYTAMRPANPFIDGAWLGVYNPDRDELLGVASLDISHWGVPDENLHPAHRTVAAVEEVVLVDSTSEGTYLRFPVENIRRRWLLCVFSRAETGEAEASAAAVPGAPLRRDPDPDMPLWALRTRRADFPLDKVKDWVLDWPDRGDPHPRVLCDKADFPAIREKVLGIAELRRTWEETKHMRSADRYLMEGDAAGLAAIEAATHGKELVEGILRNGYAGPSYCIALARPLRRYALACDVQWDSFTPEEKAEARRVCALAAYILSDGDWWQYVFTPGGTTYLPNFNSDVFCCTGLIGMFLSDHPCSPAWINFLLERMEIELEHHLRLDGGGEENVGNYLISTWTQLYMPALWGLRHCGIRDFSADPRILAGARFLLKILGPPDLRDGGLRMIPPIGHHPGARKCPPLFAWLAAFVKDADPDLAANLMWAWRAVGAPVSNAYDHSGPTANPLTRHFIFHDPTIPEIPPSRESHNLPYVGAVLRSHDLSGQGSYLFLKAGRVHSHHDDDEGSLHWFCRGVPLALDGLPLQNGATAAQHNRVSFDKPGFPTGVVEQFAVTPAADYVRTRISPRAYCVDSMYVDGSHRSGWTRELVFVKSSEPGGCEYLVVKDSVVGPDACQWNLDVLSRRPALVAPNRVWFPGHPEFDIGLDVFILEPFTPTVEFEEGVVSEKVKTAEARARLAPYELNWAINEHWLMHVPAGPGTTFLAVLFPRRRSEPEPRLAYLEREETLAIEHFAGRDMIFLRPNPWVGVSLDGVFFQGRAAFARRRGTEWDLYPLDGERLERADAARGRITIL